MAVKEFPDPRTADDDGVVAVGGDLEPESLLLAYGQGIFPWPMPDFPLIPWFCPEERGVLEFDRFHIPKSLQRFMKKSSYVCTINRAFDAVIEACARVPRKRDLGEDLSSSTWITPEMIEAYKHMHKLGYAHSVETWDVEGGNKELVGGLYGVCIKGVYAGESMFSLKDNASKVALIHLVEHLKRGGASWIDIQMVTPHMELFGARNASRDEFLDMLQKSQDPRRKLF